VTRDDMENLSLDELFNKMKKNLNRKNNIDFERRCLALLAQNSHPDGPKQKEKQKQH